MPHPVRGVLEKRIGRARTDGRRGHSLERTVFRKCTFGAKRRLSHGGSGCQRLVAVARQAPGFVRMSGRPPQ